MSATCIHSDLDAAIHPECPGCAAHMLAYSELAEIQHLSNATVNAARWSTCVGEPIDDIRNVILEQQRDTHAVRQAEIYWETVVDTRMRQEHRALGIQDDFVIIDDPHPQWPTTSTDSTMERSDLGDIVEACTWMHQKITSAMAIPSHVLNPPDLLAVRDLTPEERAEHDSEPRPGVWAGEHDADLRTITQGETDALIRFELYSVVRREERDDVVAACGGQPGMVMLVVHNDARQANATGSIPGSHGRITRQRGGIDSDPLVRLLAYRAWGDRDRQWFDERGVRSGEVVALMPRDAPPPYGHGRVVHAWSTDRPVGYAVNDARPGESVRVLQSKLGGGECDWAYRVGERLRRDPNEIRVADDFMRSGANHADLCAEFDFDRCYREHNRVRRDEEIVAIREGRMVSRQISDLEIERSQRNLIREACHLLSQELGPRSGLSFRDKVAYEHEWADGLVTDVVRVPPRHIGTRNASDLQILHDLEGIMEGTDPACATGDDLQALAALNHDTSGVIISRDSDGQLTRTSTARISRVESNRISLEPALNHHEPRRSKPTPSVPKWAKAKRGKSAPRPGR